MRNKGSNCLNKFSSFKKSKKRKKAWPKKRIYLMNKSGEIHSCNNRKKEKKKLKKKESHKKKKKLKSMKNNRTKWMKIKIKIKGVKIVIIHIKTRKNPIQSKVMQWR